MPVVVVGRGSNAQSKRSVQCTRDFVVGESEWWAGNPIPSAVNVSAAMRVGVTVGVTVYAHLLHDRQDALLLPSAHPPTAIQVLLLLQTFQRLRNDIRELIIRLHFQLVIAGPSESKRGPTRVELEGHRRVQPRYI